MRPLPNRCATFVGTLLVLNACDGTLATAPTPAEVDPRLTAAGKKAGSATDRSAGAVDASHAQAVAFAGLRVTVPRDRLVARREGSLLKACGKLIPQDYDMSVIRSYLPGKTAVAAVFHDAMVAAGLKVPSVSGSVFAGNAGAPYRIGATVTDMKLRLCTATSYWDGHRLGTIGAGSVSVTFEVYSTLRARVVYSSKVIGGGRVERPRRGGIREIVTRAFGDAAARLARDPGFVRAISAGAGDAGTASPPADRPIRLVASGALGGAILSNMNRIRRATVTVSFAGHGSGFLIDRRGYILTNAHVVGDAAQVRVKLFEGPGVVGQVLRRDPVRDVALVKIAPPGRAPLPLRRLRARVGEEVYAVGAPTNRALEASVSRGVISGVRRLPNGLVVLQADAAIHPGSSGGPLVDRSGNVVGLTVAGVLDRSGRMAAGLNLFIPIDDALKRLNLRY